MSTALIEAVHSSSLRLSLSICGAGSAAIAKLTEVAGCSRTLLHAEVLYSPAAPAIALDYKPAHLVSQRLARQLAQHAFAVGRCELGLSGASEENLVGVGATSAIQTDRQRRGADRAYVSVWGGTTGGVRDYALVLPPDWTRAAQDAEVSQLILRAIADAAAVSSELRPALHTEPEEGVVALPSDWATPYQLVLNGNVPYVLFNRTGEVRCACEPYGTEDEKAVAVAETSASQVWLDPRVPPRFLYPGSFRPLHWGHTELARAAVTTVLRARGVAPDALHRADFLSAHVTYEIAATIVDKGPVGVDDLRTRVQQFLPRGERVVVSAARLFVEKAALFPGHGFIVGVDTARRILNPQYYEGETEEAMVAALQRDVGSRGCYFVVGGRVASASTGDTSNSGHWEDLSSIHVPEALQNLFLSVPENEFRVDVSSTELRARKGASSK